MDCCIESFEIQHVLCSVSKMCLHHFTNTDIIVATIQMPEMTKMVFQVVLLEKTQEYVFMTNDGIYCA